MEKLKGAGNYNVRLTWRQPDRTPDPLGQVIKRNGNYVDVGFLWGEIEATTSEDGDGFGGDLTGQRCTINIRQFPPLVVKDRLLDVRFNELWEIESMSRGDYEWNLTCKRDDSGRFNPS